MKILHTYLLHTHGPQCSPEHFLVYSTKGLHQSKYIYKDKVNNITTSTLNIHFVKQLDLLFI